MSSNRLVLRKWSVAGITYICAVLAAAQTRIEPVIELPTAGIDDPGRYRDYSTRFYRDAEGNTVQVAVSAATGRVVNLMADAANESISFTVREPGGRPVRLRWAEGDATTGSEGGQRYLEYSVFSESPAIDIGLLLLCSMRKEREFEYQQKHLLPFDSPPYEEEELTGLLEVLNRIPAAERTRHLAILHASDIGALRARLRPVVTASVNGGRSSVCARQTSFDDSNHLSLEVSSDTAVAGVSWSGGHISVRPKGRGPVTLRVRIGTDARWLTPLSRDEIFTGEFLRTYRLAKSERDSLAALPASAGALSVRWLAQQRLDRLERQIKGVELLSFREKLLAGLPNYATYFGRDMMMSVLMMEPILQPAMLEHVIGSVAGKISSEGKVSHEEALGGQAIRENAGVYDTLITAYLDETRRGDKAEAARALERARAVLSELHRTRENYVMVDETFQFPVVVGRYLSRSDVTPGHKREFLLARTGGTTRLALLLKNLEYVDQQAAPFVSNQEPASMVSFAPIGKDRWLSGSWRDSGPGYANGRFAMDVNAIWVPKALEAMQLILRSLPSLDFPPDAIDRAFPHGRNRLRQLLRDPSLLDRPIRIWHRAFTYFLVTIPPKKAAQSIRTRIEHMTGPEKDFWMGSLGKAAPPSRGITFLALSLDARGKPIPVMNTDPATWLFLEDAGDRTQLAAPSRPDDAQIVSTFALPYPFGLFVDGVGPLIANDAYSTPGVWEAFEQDQYHSPRVVWGREVNLFLLGVAKRLLAVDSGSGNVRRGRDDTTTKVLRSALNKVRSAVEASGLKGSELWSYSVVDGRVVPARYPASCDIQLWNLTDLAVQYELGRLH